MANVALPGILLALVLFVGTPLALGYYLPRVYDRKLAYTIWLGTSLLITVGGIIIYLAVTNLYNRMGDDGNAAFVLGLPLIILAVLFIVLTRVGLWLGWRQSSK